MPSAGSKTGDVVGFAIQEAAVKLASLKLISVPIDFGVLVDKLGNSWLGSCFRGRQVAAVLTLT